MTADKRARVERYGPIPASNPERLRYKAMRLADKLDETEGVHPDEGRTVRSLLAGFDALRAERDALAATVKRVWAALDVTGYDNGPEISERVSALMAERASLQLALDAERHNHRKDNEYLVAERDRLREALRQLHDLGEWKLRHGMWESDEKVQDVYKQALAALTPTPTPEAPRG